MYIAVTAWCVDHVRDWHRPLAERIFRKIYQCSLYARRRCRLHLVLSLGYQHIKLLLREYDAFACAAAAVAGGRTVYMPKSIYFKSFIAVDLKPLQTLLLLILVDRKLDS